MKVELRQNQEHHNKITGDRRYVFQQFGYRGEPPRIDVHPALLLSCQRLVYDFGDNLDNDAGNKEQDNDPNARKQHVGPHIYIRYPFQKLIAYTHFLVYSLFWIRQTFVKPKLTQSTLPPILDALIALCAVFEVDSPNLHLLLLDDRLYVIQLVRRELDR